MPRSYSVAIVAVFGILFFSNQAMAASAIQGQPVWISHSIAEGPGSGPKGAGYTLITTDTFFYGSPTQKYVNTIHGIGVGLIEDEMTTNGLLVQTGSPVTGGAPSYIDLNQLTTNQATKPPTGSLSIDKNMVGQDGTVTLQWSVTPSQ